MTTASFSSWGAKAKSFSSRRLSGHGEESVVLKHDAHCASLLCYDGVANVQDVSNSGGRGSVGSKYQSAAFDGLDEPRHYRLRLGCARVHGKTQYEQRQKMHIILQK